MSEELLTTDEVAAILHLQPSTIRKWRRAGDGPKPTWLGYRTVRYRRSDLDAWIAGLDQVA